MGRKDLVDDLSAEALSISTRELALATGLSTRTIQRDIELGELKATRRHPRSRYRIAWDEARRYVRRVCATAAV
jgi:excisionase family DNA binding protein